VGNTGNLLRLDSSASPLVVPIFDVTVPVIVTVLSEARVTGILLAFVSCPRSIADPPIFSNSIGNGVEESTIVCGPEVGPYTSAVTGKLIVLGPSVYCTVAKYAPPDAGFVTTLSNVLI
jgi:hypothetical protein